MRATRMLSCFAPIVAAGLLTGCGGGGLTGGAPDVVVNAPSTLDGYVTSAGGVLTTASTGVAVGDNAGNDGRRGFLRFSLGAIPPGATITSAVLRVAQANVSGIPYPVLGSLHVDHVDIGLALDGADYAAPALSFDIGTLSTDPTLTLRSLDVTGRVLADRAALRTTSDFRLRFNLGTDGDSFEDSTHLEDLENSQGTGQAPVLVITYH